MSYSTSTTLCCHYCGVSLESAAQIMYLNDNLPVCHLCLLKSSREDKQKNNLSALTATIKGVEIFSEAFGKAKDSVMKLVYDSKNEALTEQVDGLLSALSVKYDISTVAEEIGIRKYLDTVVQKFTKE